MDWTGTDWLSDGTPLGGVRHVTVAMLSAWAMGQAISAVYAWAQRGRSTQRTFKNALVVSGVVGAMLMLSIGNSLARGIGIVGALALIRFRTNLQSPLDIIFIFASFASGIAAGTGNVTTGAIGTALFLGVVALLSRVEGAVSTRQAEVRVRLSAEPDVERGVRAALDRHASTVELLRRRDSGEGKDGRLRFRVDLPAGSDGSALSAAVRGVQGVVEVGVDLEEQRGEGGDDD